MNPTEINELAGQIMRVARQIMRERDIVFACLYVITTSAAISALVLLGAWFFGWPSKKEK